ncbi:hypothetical protein Tco_0361884, partial [Tanacetum coccineum]
EDASKQGRNIAEIDADVDISLVHEDAGIQGRFDDEDMFDISVFNDEKVFTGLDMADQEVNVDEKEVSAADLTIAGEVVTTASVPITVSTATPTTLPTTMSVPIISFHFHTNKYESMIRNHKKRDIR